MNRLITRLVCVIVTIVIVVLYVYFANQYQTIWPNTQLRMYFIHGGWQ